MPKKIVAWSAVARLQMRAIDRDTANRILAAIDHYLETGGGGDVKKLQPPRTDFRLRVGDYRVIFQRRGPFTIEVAGVYHRSEAYR